MPRSLRILAAHDLVFESWLLHPQIPQLAALAAKVPEATLVLNHVGTPIATGPYAADPRQTFADWHRNIRDLARHPNVVIKLGGMGMSFVSPSLAARKPRAGSEEIARTWRPCIDACIEAFGPGRCMFESNFPPDAATCSYRTLWNAFKRLAAGYSGAERAAMFSGTARRVYRLPPAATVSGTG
jgi:predicted TIM-barrel fold metal-dependent hydrolase